MNTDTIAQLLGRLNQGCNLKEAVCLGDIQTEEDLEWFQRRRNFKLCLEE